MTTSVWNNKISIKTNEINNEKADMFKFVKKPRHIISIPTCHFFDSNEHADDKTILFEMGYGTFDPFMEMSEDWSSNQWLRQYYMHPYIEIKTILSLEYRVAGL
ncbi:MAG: hypothetical protein ABJB76_04425 [Candidatus Nitrosocosmicus sp.]